MQNEGYGEMAINLAMLQWQQSAMFPKFVSLAEAEEYVAKHFTKQPTHILRDEDGYFVIWYLE